ncbi:MAG TPA: HAD family hydrolase, partial [Clostridia bacterium]|nr:HAD family hydrolase [Clostridia bacterium]
GDRVYGARDDYRLFSKAMVIKKIIEDNNLHGSSLAGFGDGYVEIENIKEVGGVAIGVATDEERMTGIDEWKRQRLIKAGADVIIADFTGLMELEAYLFGG